MARSLKPSPLKLEKSDISVYLGVTTVLVFAFAIGTMFFDYSCTPTPPHGKVCTATLPFWQLILGSIAIEAAGLIAIGLKRRKGLGWFGVVKPPLRLTIKLVLLGAAIIAATELITAGLGHFIPLFRQAQFEFGNLPALNFVEFAVMAVLIAPPLEEIIFRGILFRAIWSKTGPIIAALISSALFALVHGINGATLGIFVLGLYLCYMYKRSGSIVPGMILHAANNLFAVVLLSLGIR